MILNNLAKDINITNQNQIRVDKFGGKSKNSTCRLS
jgi:hypothetical protein